MEKEITHRIILGTILRKMRQDRGLSLRQVEEETKINFSNIRKIENGKYNTGIDYIVRLIDFYGYTIVFRFEDGVAEYVL